MIASRSCRLWERLYATVSSPSASVGVQNLRNWISTVASSPTPPASIGVSDSQSRASSIGASSAQAKAVKKRMMFKKLLNLSETEGTVGVEETLGLFRMEDINAFAKSDLMRWGKLLHNKGKIKHAAEMFDLMRRNNVAFNASASAVYVDLLLKTKGLGAAQLYYWGLPYRERSDEAYRALINGYPRKSDEEENKHFLSRIKYPDFNRKTLPPPPPLAPGALNLRLQKIIMRIHEKLGDPSEQPTRRIARKTRRVGEGCAEKA